MACNLWQERVQQIATVVPCLGGRELPRNDIKVMREAFKTHGTVIPEFFFLCYKLKEKYPESHFFQAFRYLPLSTDRPDKMIRFKTYRSFFQHDMIDELVR